MKYKFYMQKCLKDGTPIAGTLKDLEEDFEGLRYSELKGIHFVGAPKNVYTEEFSESNTLRTYVPDNVANKNTSLSLKLYFFGENRAKTYDLFNKFISNGYTKYWDEYRNKSFIFILNKEIKPATENWYKGTPYLEVTYNLTNIYGKTFDI